MIISNRHRVAGALGIAALALAACGSSSSSTAGGGSGSSSSTAADIPTADPAAVTGGTLNVGLVQEPTSFLAAGITDSMTYSYAADAPIVEGLLWYRSTDQTASAKTQADFYRPDLATEVPTVANGDVKTSGCANTDPKVKMCVTWKLRDGVQWQDGSKFGAQDVCDTAKFYWLRYGANNPTAVLSTNGYQEVLKCTQDSALQVTMDYDKQFGPYLSLFTGVYGILPAKQLEAAFAQDADPTACAAAKSCKGDLEKTPQTVDLTIGSGNTLAYKGTDTLDKIIVGTGPYVLSKYEPTKDIILVRNKNYWDKAHQPHLDTIVFQIEADVQSQLNQVKAGELDFGLDYRLKYLKDLQTLSQQGKVAVETIPESGAEKIDLNICGQSKLCGAAAKTNAALSDVKFRKALLEGINRPSIVQNIAAGATVVPQDSWLYLGAEYVKTSDVATTAYSVTKAQSDLDAAGYKASASCGGNRADLTGACINLQFATTTGNPARAAAQVAIQQDLQTLGIPTTIANVKAGKLFGSFTDGGVLYTHQFDLAMYTNTMSSPAEPDSYTPGYTTSQIPTAANNGQGQNDTGISDPAIDKGFSDGAGSVDLTVRAKAYRTAELALAADLPEIPLYQQVTVNSYTTKLKGLQRNDLVWTFNAFDWYCTGGVCQA